MFRNYIYNNNLIYVIIIMDTSEIVFSKPLKYKNTSTSQTRPIERKEKICTGTTCKTSPYCFC